MSETTKEEIAKNRRDCERLERELVTSGVGVFKGSAKTEFVYRSISGPWHEVNAWRVHKRTAKFVFAAVPHTGEGTDAPLRCIRLDRAELDRDGSAWCSTWFGGCRFYSAEGRAREEASQREIYLRNVPAWGHA
jgi:hypothetical protein